MAIDRFPGHVEGFGDLGDCVFAFAVLRYQEMYVKIQQHLSAAFPELRWQEASPSSSAGCDPDFDSVNTGLRKDDAVIQGLAITMASENISDSRWEDAVSIVGAVAQEYGFDSGQIIVRRLSDHEIDLHDQYKAELNFGTAINTTLFLRTGCHLTAEAKRRGHPGPAPTY